MPMSLSGRRSRNLIRVDTCRDTKLLEVTLQASILIVLESIFTLGRVTKSMVFIARARYSLLRTSVKSNEVVRVTVDTCGSNT